MALLRCSCCSATFELYPPFYACKECNGLLEYAYNLQELRKVKLTGSFTFWKYRPLLPEVKSVVTMGEGGTPLHKAKRLAEEMGLSNVFLKDETRNPTNSFRDRCATLMVS
ncbi:pyridoxal-phosphate dependent enzyme, partial [Candidatus Bathyarchaeota archaeon]|nr:pyridoxal-phosphate dependent enzyme [Candidatus Bathyarchaeota archaeon]